MPPKKTTGFTFIELMIVVAIVGILAAIAYPSYQLHIRKSQRADGQAMLMEVMAKQEHYYLSHNSFTHQLSDLGYRADEKIQSRQGHYEITATACDDDISRCVNLTATALAGQINDGDLSIDSLNRRSGPW